MMTKFSTVKTVTLATLLMGASMATDVAELQDNMMPVVQIQEDSGLASTSDVVPDLTEKKEKTPDQKLDDVKNDVAEKASYLDTAIKYGLVAGGIALGAAAVYFYGSALAATAAYEGSLALANYMVPNQSLATYYLITHPAAINAGVQFANSSLVQGTLGVASSALGYGLGKAGCGLYEGAKYVAQATSNAGYNAASSAYNMASNVASRAWNWFS